MKIEFDDGSHIEVLLATEKTVHIVIAAVDPNNKNKKIINSVELTTEQFVDLTKITIKQDI